MTELEGTQKKRRVAMINGQRRENRSSNFQSIIHKQKVEKMNNGWDRYGAREEGRGGTIFVPFGVVVNRHLLLVFFAALCLIFFVVVRLCRICRILIPVVHFLCAVNSALLVVVMAILRALLFLWFPEKHGDLVVCSVDAGGEGKGKLPVFLAALTGIIIVFKLNKNFTGFEGRKNGKVHGNYSNS